MPSNFLIQLWGHTVFVLFSIFIEFIGVTLVNKIIQVSGVQFYNTLSVYCIGHSTPRSSLFPSPFTPTLPSTSPSPPFLLVIIILSSVFEFCFVLFCFVSLNAFTFFTQHPYPLPSLSQSVVYIYESVSILFVSLFCSLDSTYK